MFPNPQDALPLPPRPNLEQYKKLARDLVNAGKSGDPQAIRLWATQWVTKLAELSSSDLATARVAQVAEFAQSRMFSEASRGALSHAQFVIARSHGFESWPKFQKHIGELRHANSHISNFEAAADAIVSGDIAKLELLLTAQPDLVHQRSSREHRATLLHYVSANGIENFRQKTPKNAAQIAELLLRARSEVDAEADVYGGGATTLGLVATSVHPERAGVQESLMETLLRGGANIDCHCGNCLSIVSSSLANGRVGAAEFLAAAGARLDIEAAAGLGKMDVLKTHFDHVGVRNATELQVSRGFLLACEYGRNHVVEFLLQQGIDINTQADTGLGGLHCAVIGGQLETIGILLAHGASLGAKNRYDGTALGQAMWSAIYGDSPTDYIPLLEALLSAGSLIEEGSLAWIERQPRGSSALKSRMIDLFRRHGAKS